MITLPVFTVTTAEADEIASAIKYFPRSGYVKVVKPLLELSQITADSTATTRLRDAVVAAGGDGHSDMLIVFPANDSYMRAFSNSRVVVEVTLHPDYIRDMWLDENASFEQGQVQFATYDVMHLGDLGNTPYEEHIAHFLREADRAGAGSVYFHWSQASPLCDHNGMYANVLRRSDLRRFGYDEAALPEGDVLTIAQALNARLRTESAKEFDEEDLLAAASGILITKLPYRLWSEADPVQKRNGNTWVPTALYYADQESAEVTALQMNLGSGLAMQVQPVGAAIDHENPLYQAGIVRPIRL